MTYDKKYCLEKIEELNLHNPIYDEIEGATCYLAYLNVGERGWFLHEPKSWFGSAHRVHTSEVQSVEYIDGYVIVETRNTIFTFRLID